MAISLHITYHNMDMISPKVLQKFFVFLVYLQLLLTLSKEVEGHLQCQEPDPMPSEESLIGDLEEDTRKLAEYNNNGRLRGVPCIFQNIRRERVSTNVTTRTNYVLDMSRSVCSWDYYRNIDENRIPNVLYEARCNQVQCHGCLQDNLERHKCKEIYFYVRVYRRIGCDRRTNLYQYQRSPEPLSAGCTCLAPATPREYSPDTELSPPGDKVRS